MSLKINKKELPWWFYVFSSTICPNVLIGQVFLLIFIITSIMEKVDKKKIKQWLPYLICELFFVLYSFFQIVFDVVVNKTAAFNMLQTVAICFVFDVAFVMMCSGKAEKRIQENYVSGAFWGLIVCLLLYGYTIFEGRFTCAINIDLGIVNIFGHAPTALAAIASNALIIAMTIYWKEDRKKALLYIFFFSMIILLTQSRKNIIYIGIALLFIPFFYQGKGFNVKKLKTILVGCVLAVLIVVVLMKVPFLYESIGRRLLASVDPFINTGVTEDTFGESSIRTRAALIVKAENAFEQRPIWGWGLNNFSAVINNGGYYAHNNFWEMLVSGGIVGFLLYYSKYFVILAKIIKGIKNNAPIYRRVFKISLICFLAYWVIEYWQITYMFRFIYILPLLLFAYCIRQMDFSTDKV